MLGDYIPSALGMEEGEVPLFMTVTTDYSGPCALLLPERQVRQSAAFKLPDQAKTAAKLLKAFSDKAELAAILHLQAEQELAIFINAGPATMRLLHIGSALIPEKATRDTAGVNVVNLKKNARIERVRPAEGLELADPHRYRVRTLPAAGAILKETDANEQMSL